MLDCYGHVPVVVDLASFLNTSLLLSRLHLTLLCCSVIDIRFMDRYLWHFWLSTGKSIQPV